MPRLNEKARCLSLLLYWEGRWEQRVRAKRGPMTGTARSGVGSLCGKILRELTRWSCGFLMSIVLLLSDLVRRCCA
jgi:hypothetical protein